MQMISAMARRSSGMVLWALARERMNMTMTMMMGTGFTLDDGESSFL
jgi:hypothetical protein